MALLVWSDTMNTKIMSIDKQHKRLVALINDLHGAMKGRKGRDVLAGLLDELMDYTGYHFEVEEGYFSRYGYPAATVHKSEHDLFRTKVMEFKDKFKRGDVAVTIEVMNFLKDWLYDHILVTDKKYGPFFIEKGLS